jgi:hypothetical protein
MLDHGKHGHDIKISSVNDALGNGSSNQLEATSANGLVQSQICADTGVHAIPELTEQAAIGASNVEHPGTLLYIGSHLGDSPPLE